MIPPSAKSDKNTLRGRLAVIGGLLLVALVVALLVPAARAWLLADPVGSGVMLVLVAVVLLVELPFGAWMFRKSRAKKADLETTGSPKG